ncbi:Di-copper centre-containing protein [Rhizophagus irregularis]|uniref:Di-copper centre-containing protein n=1 Tax=Rhizophagus irregularis TaxID=588596 RepID=A0A2I1FXW6_9GLOM|nr:Di-copper centre-containing protein [Rhizophagus irregularis]
MSLAKARKGLKTEKKGGKFHPGHAEDAFKITAEFMEIANKNRENAIEKVIEHANKVSETSNIELVRHALMMFISHHPSARNKNLRIPPLIKRAPGATVPKKKDVSTAEKVKETEGENPELYMNWYREDPNLSEHHEHWHIVYGAAGVPDIDNPLTKRVHKDRHGELFVYMHRQMLARYDIERLGLGLSLVKPIDDYSAQIEEGYHPNENLRDPDDRDDPYSTFGSREHKKKLRNIPNDMKDKTKVLEIKDMQASREEIEKAVKSGKFCNDTKIDIDTLGAVLESYENGNADQLIKHCGLDYYGGKVGLHGSGHLVIGNITDDPGVMTQTRTAARDPAFWRWHRHIDNLVKTWEENHQEPNDFSKSPPVKLQDVILVFKDKLPIHHGETQDEEAAAFGEKTFGGKNFCTDVSKNDIVTNELETKMKTRVWTYIEDSGKTEEIDYLFPREFYYYFRVENTSACEFIATFRVFLVPEELAESRVHWIELDKFKESLPPNKKTVVCRDCDMSSIVRQPPQKTDDELDDTALPIDTTPDQEGIHTNDTFCDCGWPFHLLLPRGRKGGMKYKLLVFISDWSEDEVPTISRCGSISFCGAQGPAEKYPDKKPMGYPLDRPFKNNSYKETFAGLNNAVIQDVCIKWVKDFPEIVVEGC